MQVNIIHLTKRLVTLFNKSLYQNIAYTSLLVGFCLCQLNSDIIHWFTLTPLGFFHHFKLWTICTFWLFEPNPFMLLTHIICIHLTFTVILTSWRTKELLRFFALINLSSALSCCVIFTILYIAADVESVYFYDSRSIRGLIGFDAAVLVATVQNMPDTVILATPFGKFKNNHVPFSWLITAITLTAINQFIVNFVYITMFCCGFYAAWCYLRFYQTHSNGTRGDRNSCFCLSSFFPYPLKPCVDSGGKILYLCLVRLKICKPAIRTFDVRALESVTTTLPLLDSADSERRKQKALKDLNDRLSKTKATTLIPWDEDANTINAALSEPMHQSLKLNVDVEASTGADSILQIENQDVGESSDNVNDA